MDLFQATNHALAHGIELGQVCSGQRGSVGIAIYLTGLDSFVHPARLLGIGRVTEDESIPSA